MSPPAPATAHTWQAAAVATNQIKSHESAGKSPLPAPSPSPDFILKYVASFWRMTTHAAAVSLLLLLLFLLLPLLLLLLLVVVDVARVALFLLRLP